MFPSTSTLVLSLASLLTLSSVSAAPTPVVHAEVAERAQPSTWATGYLEDYETYHVRYLALDCQSQHNTTFFSTCCHPLLSTESLSSRPSECTPSATASSSASAAVANATMVTGAWNATVSGEDGDEDDIYCDEATSVAAEVSSIAASISATATGSVSAVTITSSVSATGTASASAVVETLAVEEDLFVAGTVSSSSSTPSATSTTKAHHSKSSASSTSTWTPTSSSTSEWTASTTSSSSAAATTTSSSGGSGTVYTGGYATYFYQDGVAGECGTVHTDEDYVIAIDAAGWWPDYMTNSDSQYCGKYIVVTNAATGASVTAMVADVCPTCTTDNSLDLSVAAFEAIASESEGEVAITWQWQS